MLIRKLRAKMEGRVTGKTSCVTYDGESKKGKLKYEPVSVSEQIGRFIELEIG